jgi:hypothetical protein
MADEPAEPGRRDAVEDIAEAVTLVTRAAGNALDRVGEAVGGVLSGLAGDGRVEVTARVRPADGAGAVEVTVNVPAGAKPGVYKGEVQAGGEDVAPLTLEVP